MEKGDGKRHIGLLLYLTTRIGKILLITLVFRQSLSWWIWALWGCGALVFAFKWKGVGGRRRMTMENTEPFFQPGRPVIGDAVYTDPNFIYFIEQGKRI